MNWCRWLLVFLSNFDFKVSIVPSVENDKEVYFALLEMSNQFIERNAHQQGYLMNLRDEYGKIKFFKNQRDRFATFRLLDKQMVMLNWIKSNMKIFMQTGHISQIILLHNPIFADRLVSFWKNLLWDFITNSLWYFREGKDIQYKELNIIEQYFGPKVGFYFAFVRFYTVWLLIPALLGVIFTILIRIFDNIYSIGLIPYSFVITIWLIVFYIKWRRKTAELSMNWDTFNTKNKTERDSFVGIDYYNINVNKIQK